VTEVDRKIADLAEAYLAGKVSWKAFMDAAPDASVNLSDEADELCYEIEHEPKVGGLLGISPAQARRRLERLQELIRACRGA